MATARCIALHMLSIAQSYLSVGHSGRIGNEMTAWYRDVTYRGFEMDAPRGADEIRNSLRTGEIPANLNARRHLATCPTNEPFYDEAISEAACTLRDAESSYPL